MPAMLTMVQQATPAQHHPALLLAMRMLLTYRTVPMGWDGRGGRYLGGKVSVGLKGCIAVLLCVSAG